MIPLTDFMEGRELRDPNRETPVPLDFAVTDGQLTLCVMADWWTTDWGMDKGLFVMNAPLAEDGTFEGLGTTYAIETFTDDFFADTFARSRRRIDLRRGVYLQELDRLRDFEPRFDLSGWRRLIGERPILNPIAELVADQDRMRATTLIRLTDGTGRTVDVLAIDELGNAATVDPRGFLSLFADRWSGYDAPQRPDPAEFAAWLVTQRPPGPVSLETPEVISAQGSLQEVAREALTRTNAT